MSFFRIALSVLMSGFLCAGSYASEIATLCKNEQTQHNLIQLMQGKVQETIQYSQDIPGLNSDAFSALRTEI
jgi:hypothetical protein